MTLDEPIEAGTAALTLLVGRDTAGHWLVQDSAGQIEGHFISERAAMRFARDEGEIHHAAVALAVPPMVPRVALP